MPIEGRVLPGLDEFMLRLGHLRVVCTAASETGGGWKRAERATVQRLIDPVELAPSEIARVARYLAYKNLCPTAKSEPANGVKYRYPEIQIIDEGTALSLTSFRDNTNPPFVWWQDYCLSDTRVRSTVGAVTAAAKSGSKTGVSHVLDWALALELVTNSGQLTADGALIAKIDESRAQDHRNWNPYLIEMERIVFGYLYFQKDLDIFVRFGQRLSAETPPVKKGRCRELFADALEEIAREAEDSKILSRRSQYSLFQQLRDLERTARRKGRRSGETSTAWHRAASRVETWVDLRLLNKTTNGDKAKYEYSYYPSENMALALDSAEKAQSADEWIYGPMMPALFQNDTGSVHENLTLQTLTEVLPSALDIVTSPSRVIPIDTLAVAVTYLSAVAGRLFTLGAVRSAIEKLAREKPDIARLSRGSVGERAEFISINPVKI